ncbi:hypothetical protein A1351_09165 [Methylosinus sp. R-45379]|uniref:general secretion pathway protein GspK n=1 Tax=unclassified Methylosinus TaxID=2624500 RepID=UPI00047BC20C|nr:MULTISPECIES: type II secretion system protein GspK [unclassified Methylosinus]OAI30433.1 hypothetical protein A1351_09165 [Methylosinus sp. R-45379]TDX61388.1 general secretion pathway protein K [Methylosinus sp. sav-2]
MRSGSRLDPRRGVVLVAVLWTIALLSTLAMAAGAGFRGFAGVLAVDRDRVQAEALFTAGLEAGADLLAKYHGRPLRPVETRISLSTGAARVRLGDELGRIDINKAPVEVFASLFAEVGAPDANEVARAIVLWRDGQLKTAAQKETAEPPPQQGENPSAAKPQPGEKPPEKQELEQVFTNVDQLAQIPAVTPAHVGLVAPYVTVFGAATVNAATAPPQILRALPEMTEAKVEQLLEARSASPIEPARIEQILGPAARYAKLATRSVARLRITVALADGYAAAAEAVIVILPKDRQPYRVLFFEQKPTPIDAGERRFFE